MPTIDLPTLFLLSTALFVMMGAMFLVTWHQDRQNNLAMLHWAGAHFIGAPACVLLSLRGEIPGWASIGLANALILFGFGLLLSGALAFEERRGGLAALVVGPVVWIASSQVPWIWDHFSHRVVLVSFLIFAHTATTAVVIWQGQANTPLPTRRLAAILLATVAVAHLSRLLLATATPPTESFAVLGRGWTAFIALQILLQEVLLGYALLAMVKERAESRQRLAAEVDVLTGALTRRAFFERARRRLVEEPTRGAVLIFDLDRFKAINDTHGHIAGDRVLAEFAAVVRARLSVDDVFGRWGGEEFAVLSAHADIGAAWRLAEGIRRDFSGLAITHHGQTITATVSVGVAVVPLVEPDLDRLVASADAALYLAKSAGRDRVEAVEPREEPAGAVPGGWRLPAVRSAC